ncbi:MAG: NirD/YgiW/YdeI family stress tolerance protein [Bacteroidetes bacterium]|jgi:uncharacterized protein YdeI (BOF family)|nr:NirD/YgiW/YdeI family stress tolerance protein [Bacteroidota bacterium]
MKAINKEVPSIMLLIIACLVMIPNAFSQENQSVIKITRISELENYADSYIKGEVIKILDVDKFRFEDSSGNIKVYTGWKNTNLVKKNEKITIRGKLDPGIVKEFYATEIIMENGEIIKLKIDD